MPTSRQVRPKHPALPAQWLYDLLRALPGVSGFLVTVAAQDRSAQLDPGVEGTGPRGLTVRIAPHVLQHHASIATHLTSGDEWPNVPHGEAGWLL
jgi:hypothetical protein